MKLLEVKNLFFTYANSSLPSLKKINLQIFKNRITSIIGPSGCGKSTLLRCFNRIHDLYPGNKYEGEILLRGEGGDMENILSYKSEYELIKLRQRVGMIFQKPIPFPMSIFENIAYGLRLIGVKEELIKEKVKDALKSVALWNSVKDRLKDDARVLSGGEQQKLCIARAIALNPEILLMDEPTSALDPISTSAIEELILGLKKRVTIIIVTHNMQQAKRISDFTAFMYLGKVVEYNKSEEIFLNPKEKETADYIAGKIG